MDGFELNKIIGWALAALLVIFGGRTFVEIYNGGHGDHGEHKPAYAIEVADSGAKKGAEKKAEVAVDIKTLIASADIDSGAKVAKKCAACHTFDKGGANKTGPALYGVVNRDLASASGFGYSDALKAKGGKWDYDALAKFLAKPKDFAPGTAMNFGGIKKDNQLASLIAYLRSLSDNPAPLP
ncbi:MAG: cytochrome c family protein [Rhodomicrobium sp.]|nr:MAG: cytochrome c family protein [Rhodomicrobium sp.]